MGIKNTLIRLGDIPRRNAVITLLGSGEVNVENCVCVFGCDENLMILRTQDTLIKIHGTDLVLDNFGAYGVKVRGAIHSLGLEEL